MSYMQGQAFRILLDHRWSSILGGCAGDHCEWEGPHDEIEQVAHAEHVADVLHASGVLAESRKSINVYKAQALYEVAEELCTCDVEWEDSDPSLHFDDCPTFILTKKADKLSWS